MVDGRLNGKRSNPFKSHSHRHRHRLTIEIYANVDDFKSNDILVHIFYGLIIKLRFQRETEWERGGKRNWNRKIIIIIIIAIMLMILLRLMMVILKINFELNQKIKFPFRSVLVPLTVDYCFSRFLFSRILVYSLNKNKAKQQKKN